jgi:hypothetical protein
VILSLHAIEQVAGRIERAYRRRVHKEDQAWGGPDPRLWTLAARALVEAHRNQPWLPLDPELFVMSQPRTIPLDDPWRDLAPSEAVRRYRRRVLKIVRGLRREIRGEVRRTEARVARGESLEQILRRPSKRLSALGGYLVAVRAGRHDLAEPLTERIYDQHAGCPLYRLACRHLLPGAAYPVLDLLPGLVLTRRRGPVPRGDALN